MGWWGSVPASMLVFFCTVLTFFRPKWGHRVVQASEWRGVDPHRFLWVYITYCSE